MIRILQLTDHVTDVETQRASEGLSRALGNGFAVEARTIGEGGTYRNVVTATANLRRGGGTFDLVHAFGGRALAAAALGTRWPIVFSPAPETKSATREWLRAVMAHRKVEVVCATSTLRKRLVQRGVPIEQCHLIRPGVEFSRVRRRKDEALRGQLGFSDREYVLLCAGESTRAAAHADAVWAAGILHYADAKYRLLVWGTGKRRGA